MAATPSRATRRQTDAPPVPSRSDSAISSHLTPVSVRPTSSPTPLTPERGRSTSRYPDSLGRIPLHRRGTSKTYERLEDLLREAGYKETRVFTPEADRTARSATEKHQGGAGNSMRGGVGAVVDFITGLVSRGSSLPCEAAPPIKDGSARPALDAWSPPPSPLAHVLQIKDDRANRGPSGSVESVPRNGSSESMRRHIYVDMSENASQRAHTYQVAQLHQDSQGLAHHPHSKLGPHHHRRHHQLYNYSSKTSSTKPNPPNARAYLRHMSSAPNIQPLIKRPSVSEASLRSHVIGREHRSNMRHMFILNDEESIAESDCGSRTPNTIDVDGHPPLPRNWIDSVAKALLGGVGGPVPAVTSDAASTRTAKTASTRRSSALSDTSNRETRGRAAKRAARPPLLCMQVQDKKARTSEGQVVCTRVMCRSTPTSRANSRARNSGRDDQRHTTTTHAGKRREGDKSRNRRRGKDQDARVVPSLARTRAENDDWVAPRQRYLDGWGMRGSAQAYPEGIWSDDSDGGGDDEDDEDEEGELGLDRLLVPALRQHSIQSLRRHLQRPLSRMSSDHDTAYPRSPGSGRASPFGGAPASRRNQGDATWSTSRSRGWLANQGEEDEDGYSHVFSGAEVGISRTSTKWRRGLPGLAQWTTSS